MGQSTSERGNPSSSDIETEQLVEMNKFWLNDSGEPLEMEHLLEMFEQPKDAESIQLLDVSDRLPQAMLALEDPSVSALRFSLVPARVSEDLFWTLFFYYLDGGTFHKKKGMGHLANKDVGENIGGIVSTVNLKESTGRLEEKEAGPQANKYESENAGDINNSVNSDESTGQVDKTEVGHLVNKKESENVADFLNLINLEEGTTQVEGKEVGHLDRENNAGGIVNTVNLEENTSRVQVKEEEVGHRANTKYGENVSDINNTANLEESTSQTDEMEIKITFKNTTAAEQAADESGNCTKAKKIRATAKKNKKKKRNKKYLAEGGEQVVESLLLKKNFCHLYKIPPQRNAIGHYAEDWNLEKSIWMGTLKMIEPGIEGSRILLRFVDADGSIFLESVCADLEKGEELLTPVADSSRFWTTFIQPPSNPEKRYAIGFGFAERPCAEDIRFAVADHRDRYLRHSRGKLKKLESDNDSEPRPADDLTLPRRSEVMVSNIKVPLLPAPPL